MLKDIFRGFKEEPSHLSLLFWGPFGGTVGTPLAIYLAALGADILEDAFRLPVPQISASVITWGRVLDGTLAGTALGIISFLGASWNAGRRSRKGYVNY